MRKLFLIPLCLGVAVAASAASAAKPCFTPGQGKLLLGGGMWDEAYYQRGAVLCGGPEAAILMIVDVPSVSAEEAKAFADDYHKKGWTNVSVLDLSDEERAVAQVRQAAHIEFSVNAQADMMALLDAKPRVAAAIRERFAGGALVAGNGGGAAVVTKVMAITGDKADLKSLKKGGTPTRAGLGLWPEAMVDAFFVTRQRWARLVAPLLDNPGHVGVGIDEGTALLVDGPTLEVFGTGTVTLFDARKAKVQPAAADGVLSASGIGLTVLRGGDRFNWKTGRPIAHR